MPEPTPEVWAQIRRDYENTDKPLAHICADNDVTIPMMRYRMKRWEWTRRKPFVPRQQPAALPLPSPGGGGSANAGGMSRGGVSLLRETFTPPRSQDARDPPPPGEGKEGTQARPGEDNIEPEDIAPRLRCVMARVLPAIEDAIARLTNATPRELEQAGRTLSALTRTLRELNAVLLQQNAPPAAAPVDDDPVPEDIDELRFELAKRIRAFVEANKVEDMEPGQDAGQEHRPVAAAMDGLAGA